MNASDRIPARWVEGMLATGAAALAVMWPVAGSAADVPPDTRAQALFEGAIQLQSSGQIADACPMFADSQRLAPGIGVTLHLADCYERLGRAASAWRQFRAAERMAVERGDERRASLAHARAQALEPKLDRLTVTVGTAAHDGWQVIIDGASLPVDRWNVALALDPGDHVVIIQAPDRPSRTWRVHLDATTPAATLNADPGAALTPTPTATAAAPTLAPTTADPDAAARARTSPAAPSPATNPAAAAAGPAPAAVAPAAPSAPTTAAATASTPPVRTAAVALPGFEPTGTPTREPPTQGISAARLGIGIGLAGLGAVGVGFGTFFLVRRSVFISHDCTCDVTLENEASTGAMISFGVGGAALASAAVLLLTAPAPKPQVGWSLTPVPLMGGAGALIRTSF